MALGFIIIGMLVVGLGLFQAWTLWYVKREVARLDQRLNESLDDEDLLEFQERLQGLLDQTKTAGLSMVDQVDRRQAALEKALERVREAEAKLTDRAHLLERAAEAATQRAAKLQAEAPLAAKPKPGKAASKAVKAKEAPAKPLAPLSRELRPAPPPSPAELEPGETALPEAFEEGDDKGRSYLVRNTAAPEPVSRHQKVYDLADRGLTHEQIAKEAGILTGEVDLILNLRPKRRGKG